MISKDVCGWVGWFGFVTTRCGCLMLLGMFVMMLLFDAAHDSCKVLLLTDAQRREHYASQADSGCHGEKWYDIITHALLTAAARWHYTPAGVAVTCWNGVSTAEACSTPPSFAWSIANPPCAWSFAVQFNAISSTALSYTAVFKPNFPQSLPASVAIIHTAFNQTNAKVSRNSRQISSALPLARDPITQISMMALPRSAPQPNVRSSIGTPPLLLCSHWHSSPAHVIRHARRRVAVLGPGLRFNRTDHDRLPRRRP